MHAFNTCMLSVMGHPLAQKIISQAQRLATLFRASHQPLFLLNKLAASMGVKRTLITSNKTRFSSVHASLESVSRLQSALQELVRQHPRLCTAAVIATIGSDSALDKYDFCTMNNASTVFEPKQDALSKRLQTPLFWSKLGKD